MRNRLDEMRCMELYEAGQTDLDIAEQLGVSETTVAQWRHRTGHLKKHRKAKSEDVIQIEKQAREQHTTYGALTAPQVQVHIPEGLQSQREREMQAAEPKAAETAAPSPAVGDAPEEKPTKVDRHRSICLALNGLYEAKNSDYGDAFGKTYRELGILSAVTRISDKYNRLVSLATKPEAARRIKDESIRDTLADLANYCVMTLLEMEE